MIFKTALAKRARYRSISSSELRLNISNHSFKVRPTPLKVSWSKMEECDLNKDLTAVYFTKKCLEEIEQFKKGKSCSSPSVFN